MSSSNAVQLIAVPELTYGYTPTLATAVAQVIRHTSESLSGTPETTQSEESRNDRMSGGQVVVGLNSGGDINFELSADPVYKLFVQMAMMSAAVASLAFAAGSIAQAKDPTDEQLATLTVADTTGLAAGDVVTLTGFATSINNGPRQIVSVDSGTALTIITPRAATDETAAAGVMTRPAYVDIGSTVQSVTLSKAYTDVTHDVTSNEHSQRYTGALVSAMSIAMQYGEVVTGTFSFLANGYTQEAPSLAQQIETAGGTVTPAGTAQPLNGSVDMPLVTVDGEPTDFCIASLSLSLDNGLTPQNCLGRIAPAKYNLGTAAITVQASIYLGDQSYDKFMPGKLTQAPVGMCFATSNADGGFAFDLRAVQLSFPDPANGGAGQDVMIDAEGTAKVGEDGASALRIYYW